MHGNDGRTVGFVLETLETRAAAEAVARLVEKHSREFQRLYAQAVHPQNGGSTVVLDEPLLDATGKLVEVGMRVRRPDGVLGEVIRLNKPRRAAVVLGDDGSERFVMAHRLKVTSRSRKVEEIVAA